VANGDPGGCLQGHGGLQGWLVAHGGQWDLLGVYHGGLRGHEGQCGGTGGHHGQFRAGGGRWGCLVAAGGRVPAHGGPRGGPGGGGGQEGAEGDGQRSCGVAPHVLGVGPVGPQVGVTPGGSTQLLAVSRDPPRAITAKSTLGCPTMPLGPPCPFWDSHVSLGTPKCS